MAAGLSDRDVLRFYHDGFVTLERCVPEHLVAPARSFVMSAVTQGQVVNDNLSSLNLIPDLRGDAVLMALLTPTLGAIESLMGIGCIAHTSKAQVAIRLPDKEVGHREEAHAVGQRWHVDGNRRGQHTPFNILCGVCLTDLSRPGMGNLAVHPRTWTRVQHILRDGAVHVRESMFLSYNAGAEEGKLLKPDLGVPMELTMQPGDVVLLSQRTPHLATSNQSSMTRCMVYFRIRHPELNELKVSGLLDSLCLFPGLRRILFARRSTTAGAALHAIQ